MSTYTCPNGCDLRGDPIPARHFDPALHDVDPKHHADAMERRLRLLRPDRGGRMNPEDDPDLFQCSICEQFRSVDERHIGNGHTHPGDWCDACADGPGLWRLRKR